VVEFCGGGVKIVNDDDQKLDRYFQQWLGPLIRKNIDAGEPCLIFSPIPMKELHRLALDWLWGKVPCVLCGHPATKFNRRTLSAEQALFIPLCEFCGTLGGHCVDELYEALYGAGSMPQPDRLTRLIEEATR
jgi:hypothetical protein